jgi:hypothetical protein
MSAAPSVGNLVVTATFRDQNSTDVGELRLVDPPSACDVNVELNDAADSHTPPPTPAENDDRARDLCRTRSPYPETR